MTCEFASSVLHGYLDGELDAARSAEFERHLQSCFDCGAMLKRQEALRAAMREARLREPSPPGLRDKVLGALPVSPRRTLSSRAWSLGWLAVAAACLLVFFLARSALSPPKAAQLAGIRVDQILDAHLRSQQPGHLLDVTSSDRHTVKPWLDGRLNFAPAVPDLSAAGFPLIGGRLDVLDGRTVAALVYGRRKHLINVFVWPVRDDDPRESGSGASLGYQWVCWRAAGMEYCAISDVTTADLRELAGLFQK